MKIRIITNKDFDKWKPLFEGYCDFYHEEVSEQKNLAVWAWINDKNHMMRGLVAESDSGELLGLAHYYPWPATIYGCDICYLSDLYVSPSARGNKVGKKIYEHLLDECKREGWPALTLLTQDGNSLARSLYDQYGEKSDFGFYISPVEI